MLAQLSGQRGGSRLEGHRKNLASRLLWFGTAIGSVVRFPMLRRPLAILENLSVILHGDRNFVV
ncbi:hypothetical protein RBSH_03665 [Rhodopirellula baltica SH28]|uniref:Uncharacterized protein n=1 Tax=Rhodopirellula baltica SH28 TaxID=993517 RepID=K5E5D3_RHOBT|nr:hypothetical protein RBSH_03665 [Rhodopirellula baltica SH28]